MVAVRRSLTFTSLFGSAPWSPLALMVDVYGIDVHRAVVVDLPGDVAASTRRRVERRWIVRHAVGNADVQTILKNVIQMPDTVRETPLLHARCRLACGVRNVSVDGRRHQRAIAFIANIDVKSGR